MKTIKIILLLFCIILGINAKAQTVGYTYKALAAEGCNMKYSVAKQDTIYSIVATVRSDRMKFLTKPTMKIRTFTGKYLELRGTVIGNGSQSAGVISGIIVTTVNDRFVFVLFDFLFLDKSCFFGSDTFKKYRCRFVIRVLRYKFSLYRPLEYAVF